MMIKPNTMPMLARCIAELESREPLTRERIAEHECLVAAEMARAEARRAPSPQLELGEFGRG